LGILALAFSEDQSLSNESLVLARKGKVGLFIRIEKVINRRKVAILLHFLHLMPNLVALYQVQVLRLNVVIEISVFFVDDFMTLYSKVRLFFALFLAVDSLNHILHSRKFFVSADRLVYQLQGGHIVGLFLFDGVLGLPLELLVGYCQLGLAGGVEQSVGGLLRKQIDEYLLKFLLLLLLLFVQPPHKVLVLLEQALVLVHEVSRHLLQILLIDPQFLDPLGDWDLGAAPTGGLVELNLRLLALLLLVLAADSPEQTLGARLEILVHVNILTLGVAYLVEAVHVELANEGGEVVVFEVLGQNLLSEPSNALYGEGVPGGSPLDDFRVVPALNQIDATSIIS